MQVGAEDEASTRSTSERPQFDIDFTRRGEGKAMQPVRQCILSDKFSGETREKPDKDNVTLGGGHTSVCDEVG